MLTQQQFKNLRARIKATLKKNAGISPATTTKLLPSKNLQGKLYEAHVLSMIIENLVTKEGCSITLISSGTLMLKQKGGPVNRSYPYFQVSKAGAPFAELFTDVEFLSLSSTLKSTSSITGADYHELDIALLKPGVPDRQRPTYMQVFLGVECKATTIEKSTFREVLGFRRELAYRFKQLFPTQFSKWPLAHVPTQPNSVHMCYSTDRAILKYKDNGAIFGIVMVHEPI